MLIWVVLLAGAGAAASAANFSGKWAIQNPSGRGGRGGPTILVLNQVGNEVTGTMGQRVDMGSGSPVGQDIMFGKVEGDTLTFYVWVGGDEPVKQTYRGTMSGDEITFTVTGGRGGGAGGGGRGATGGGGPAPAGQQPAAATAGQTAPATQQVTARRVK
jgi:hypothetical protein